MFKKTKHLHIWGRPFRFIDVCRVKFPVFKWPYITAQFVFTDVWRLYAKTGLMHSKDTYINLKAIGLPVHFHRVIWHTRHWIALYSPWLDPYLDWGKSATFWIHLFIICSDHLKMCSVFGIKCCFIFFNTLFLVSNRAILFYLILMRSDDWQHWLVISWKD